MKRAALAFLLVVPFVAACPVKTNTATDIVLPAEGSAKLPPEPTPVASPEPTGTPAKTMGEKPAEETGPLYLLRDSGKRCITSPCPSWAAVDVETRVEREITGVDLSALALDVKSLDRVRRRVLTGLVWVRGEIKTVPKQGPAGDGTVLVVSAVVEADEAPAP